jgi:hypothetical protein
MLIFVDRKAPGPALRRLKVFGKVVLFHTENIVYEAISGHPDIFMTEFSDYVVTAPNLPEKYKNLLKESGVSFKEGHLALTGKYPGTARYNAVATPGYFIHNLSLSDPVLRNGAAQKTGIHVAQGYTRCNLIALGNNRMITSDRGIYKTLAALKTDVLYVNPEGILLPGFANGFIGGTCGWFQNKIFFLGNLKYLSGGEAVKRFIEDSGYEIVELYNGPLFDGGGIFFL